VAADDQQIGLVTFEGVVIDRQAWFQRGVLSRDGRQLYLGLWFHGGVVALTASAAGWERTQLLLDDASPALNGLAATYGLALSPDDRHLYVTGFLDDTLTALRRDSGSGKLRVVQRFRGNGKGRLRGPVGIDVDSSGQTVVVASTADDALTAFRRQARSGRLVLQSRFVQGVGGVDGLMAAADVVVSPDGRHVYVGAFSSIAIFERLPGGLRWMGVVRHPSPGQSFGYLVDLEFDPSGAHLYAISPTTSELVAFVREPASGDLTMVETVRGLTGLAGASGLAVSSDRVYTAGTIESAVAVFSRDSSTGRLQYLGVVREGEEGATGTCTWRRPGAMPLPCLTEIPADGWEPPARTPMRS
jgi:6-phosphogluconolactonase (cycloisomerase 2 family)